jgi:hypothetical protein
MPPPSPREPSTRPKSAKTSPKKTGTAAASSTTQWKVNVILDTKARREYPKAATNVTIKCDADRVEFRDVAWLQAEAEKGLGITLSGIRPMKGSGVLSATDSLSSLTPGESVVGFLDEETLGKSPKKPMMRKTGSLTKSNSLRNRENSKESVRTSKDSVRSIASGGRKGSLDRMHKMSAAGTAKSKLHLDREKNAASIKAAAEEEELKKHAYAPKTNIVTKRKIEERKLKEKQKKAGNRRKTLAHLTDGGWKGEMPLPNSYDKPGTVTTSFTITVDEPQGESKGWMNLLPECEFGGTEGMIVKWSARPSSLSSSPSSSISSPSSSSSSKKGLNRSSSLTEKESPMWDIDLTFPPAISATPIPCLMRFAPNGHIIEIALPGGTKKDKPTALNPMPFFGSHAPIIERPNTVEWPNPVITLNMVSHEELIPKPRKELILGTSLKNVTMSILKQVKKLCIDVLVTPDGTPLADGQEPVEVCLKIWHIKFKFKLKVDPFWTIMRLHVGLKRIYEDNPFVLPGGKISDPVYLAQACEDEKDGRLQDFLDETIGDLVDRCMDIELECLDMGTHTKRSSDDDEVEWFMGNSTCGNDPLSVYLATTPSVEATRRYHYLRLHDPRPSRPCDLIGISGMKNGAGGDDDEDGEDLGPQAVKGTRGKLIMQAERNKKALEDGTYGNSNAAFEAGSGTLGQGTLLANADPNATVVQIRLMKLKANKGKGLSEEGGSHAEIEAEALMKRRAERLKAGGDVKQLNKMRKARLNIMSSLASLAMGEDGIVKKRIPGSPRTDTVAAAALAKAKTVAIETRFKHNELYRNVQLFASRKRTRNAEFQAQLKEESALLKGIAVTRTPDEIRREWERMIAARKRKLMDFLPGSSSSSGGHETIAAANARAQAAKQEAPLGGSKKNQPEMTEEEKEMLAILKGINTSNSDKFAGGSGGSGPMTAMEVTRKKIKDPSKTAEIAAMRLDVLLSKKK